MNFKKLNLFVMALILVTIGAIFFIRIYNEKIIQRELVENKKVDDTPKIPSLNERVEKFLNKLKNEGIIEIRNENIKKIVFREKKVEDIIREELKNYDDKIAFQINKEDIIFYEANEKISVPYVFKDEKPKLIIVIDDIGNSIDLGERVLRLENVTLSIIPQLKYSFYFAKKGKELNKDILIHVPMEPHSFDKYKNGETKFLTTEMDNEDIKKLSKFYLESVPYAIGANNHMGSKFTENEEKMKIFLEGIKERNLFFLDSRTSVNSVASNVAQQLGLKFFVRDIFLDHELDEEIISQQLDKAIKIAKEKGYAIAIGHPHRETLSVLEKRLPDIKKEVSIVPISFLIKMKRG